MSTSEWLRLFAGLNPAARNIWLEYERGKAIVSQHATTPAEYQQGLLVLCRFFGV